MGDVGVGDRAGAGKTTLGALREAPIEEIGAALVQEGGAMGDDNAAE